MGPCGMLGAVVRTSVVLPTGTPLHGRDGDVAAVLRRMAIGKSNNGYMPRIVAGAASEAPAALQR